MSAESGEETAKEAEVHCKSKYMLCLSTIAMHRVWRLRSPVLQTLPVTNAASILNWTPLCSVAFRCPPDAMRWTLKLEPLVRLTGIVLCPRLVLLAAWFL
jgi:hypothetical protein